MRISIPSLGMPKFAPHVRPSITNALPAALVLVFGSLSAQADEPRGVLDDWGVNSLGIEGCAGVLERSEFSTAVDCVADQVFSGLLDTAFQFIDDRGKAQFGENFHLEQRLGVSTSGGGLSGDLDAVIPLHSFASVSGDAVTRATFVQNGLSRWRDEHGFQRNDVRFGAVHRSALNDWSGILGTSVFFQKNVERGHARVVLGLDYLSRWGRGSLNYHMPVTDWKPGRFGHEERALAGAELGFDFDVTRTINLRAAAGHWERKDGSDEWATQGRLSIGWQPHPWFGLRGNWDGIGTVDDLPGMHALVAVPFGGGENQHPRWQGLGTGSAGSEEPAPNRIWDSVANVGQVAVAERLTTPVPAGSAPEDASAEAHDSQTLIGQIFGQQGPEQP